MKLRGYLKELPDGKFVVRHADLNKVKPIFIDVPLHPSIMNNTDLEHGKEIEFIVKQIAIGEDEFSVVDCDVALLVYDEIPQDTSILDQIVENYPDDEILKADGLDGGIIGIEENSMRLVYSKSKVIEILMSEDMTEEDALEHYYYNIVGAYVGEKTPIFVEDTYI